MSREKISEILLPVIVETGLQVSRGIFRVKKISINSLYAAIVNSPEKKVHTQGIISSLHITTEKKQDARLPSACFLADRIWFWSTFASFLIIRVCLQNFTQTSYRLMPYSLFIYFYINCSRFWSKLQIARFCSERLKIEYLLGGTLIVEMQQVILKKMGGFAECRINSQLITFFKCRAAALTTQGTNSAICRLSGLLWRKTINANLEEKNPAESSELNWAWLS